MRSQGILAKTQGELIQELMEGSLSQLKVNETLKTTNADQLLQITELFRALARTGAQPSVWKVCTPPVACTCWGEPCPLLCIPGVAHAEWFGMLTSLTSD